jgi:hypothetical protein
MKLRNAVAISAFALLLVSAALFHNNIQRVEAQPPNTFLFAQQISQAAAAYSQSLLVPSSQPAALSNLLNATCNYMKAQGQKCGVPAHPRVAGLLSLPVVEAQSGPTTYSIGSQTVPVGTNTSVGTFAVPASDATFLQISLDATDLATKPGSSVDLEAEFSSDSGTTWRGAGGGTFPGGITENWIGIQTNSLPLSASGVVRLKLSVSGQSIATSGAVTFCGGDDCPTFPPN